MSSFTVITKVPLPAHVAPEAVIAAIQAYRPLIEANPHLQNYERRGVGIQEVVDDPFFRDDGKRLQAFTVYQRVTIIPGVGSWATKDVAVPCVFQSCQFGARCRAEASAGVTVRSSYEVRRRGEIRSGSKPEPPPGPGEGDYELVEVSNVECGALVKPFVRHSLAGAHQEVLQRLADEVVRNYEAQRPESSYERPSAPASQGLPRPVTTYDVQTSTSSYDAPRMSDYEAQYAAQYAATNYAPQPSTRNNDAQTQPPPVTQPPGNFI